MPGFSPLPPGRCTSQIPGRRRSCGYCDRGALLRELKKYSSGKCDLSLFNVWYDESAAMHQFITDCYAEYAPDLKCQVTVGDEAHWPTEDPTGLFFPVCEHFWGFGGMSRLDMFEQIMKDKAGVSVDYSTALVKIERVEGGKVTGVIAKNVDTGAYIRINASKGVLLACAAARRAMGTRKGEQLT